MLPGYHQNKEHWNTIILDGTIPDKDVKADDCKSYDIITDSPTKRIYEAVKTIPKGKSGNLWKGGRACRESENVQSCWKCPAP